MSQWKWWQNCLFLLGLILGGWLVIIAIGYAILRGITALLSLYED